MSRIRGLEQNEAPRSLRWIYGKMRSMFGKELTPFKVRARVPKLAWAEAVMEVMLKRSHTLPARLHEIAQLRAAVRIGCPF
jgi:hypothetical protein